MIEPIEYQSRLPAGYRLRCLTDDRLARISRDVPGAGLLWSEASAALFLVVCGTVAAWAVRRWVGGLQVSHDISTILYCVGHGALGSCAFLVGPVAWLNVGIFVEIAVSADTLYWRKRNVWGSREYFWPLSTIDAVSVQNRLLRVRRRRGPALAAFSFVKAEERLYACDLLNAAIARHRHARSTSGSLWVGT